MGMTDSCTYEIPMTDIKMATPFEEPFCMKETSNGEKKDAWRCPHPQTEGDSVCIFHQSITEKQDEEVLEALIEILNTPPEERGSRQLEFIGAKFGDLNLHTTGVSWEYDDPLIFERATFHGLVHLPSEFFETNTQFVNAEFHDTVDLPNRINSRATFEGATFHEQLKGYGTTFASRVNFGGALFEGTADLAESEYNDRADFSWTEFRDLGHFWQAKFNAAVTFQQADFERAVFAEAEAQEDINFKLSEFASSARFDDATLSQADFSETDLSEAMFSNANLQYATFESAILSRAALLGADLRGCQFNGTVMGNVQIDGETCFLGNPSTEASYSEHSIAALREQRCCVYDPDFDGETETHDIDKARRTYRMIEKLAADAGLSGLQSQCFVRRQDLQTNQYKSDSLSAQSWEERLIAGIRFSRAKIARVTLLYGESPWRIIGGSILFILSMAVIYPIGGWLQPVGQRPITYDQILTGDWGLFLESLYFSTLTFTTLGMGDYTPLGFGQILATLNTAFGAILVALLVFVLGRRAAR